MLHRGSNCSPPRAMDGRIMCHGIISSCQSAATYEIVKRCCSSLVSSAVTSTQTVTFTHSVILTERVSRHNTTKQLNSSLHILRPMLYCRSVQHTARGPQSARQAFLSPREVSLILAKFNRQLLCVLSCFNDCEYMLQKCQE